MPSPAASASVDQSRYQVRLEWGAAGLARLAAADVVVVVDALTFSSDVSARVAAGETVALADAGPDAVDAADVVRRAAASGAVVLVGGLRNATAVAAEVVAEQGRRAARTSIAVVAVGETLDEGALRVATEDLLAAGAVIDALSALGIDHTSPEAATACEAFRGLRGAVKHLLTATGSGQRLLEAGRRDDALAAAQVDADAVAPVLRDGVFTAA